MHQVFDKIFKPVQPHLAKIFQYFTGLKKKIMVLQKILQNFKKVDEISQ
jgi:hypothetical protein